MTNENETVDIYHELSVLNDLIWEYGELRISEYEGSECAADENRRDINEKFEIIKREIAAKDAEIDGLKSMLNNALEATGYNRAASGTEQDGEAK